MELTSEDINFFTQNSTGSMVIYLGSQYRDKGDDLLQHHSPLDYHLHVLFYWDEKLKNFGGICLDTFDLSIEHFERSDFNQNIEGRKIALKLARLFIDRINSALKTEQIIEEKLFNRAPAPLWTRYNEIKRTSYLDSLKRFQSYLEFTKITLKETSQKLQEIEQEMYTWAQISLSEERFLPIDQEQNTSSTV